MSSKTDDPTAAQRIGAEIREAVSTSTIIMVVVGVLAGYSIGVIGKDAVVLPFVGSVPGLPLGVVGLLATAGIYRQFGSKCGCAGDCGDSCSYDP
jgi:hypothetical protein